MMNDLPEGQTQSDQTPDGAASVLSAELGVTAPRRKMPPLCYVNMQTLDTAVGFWNSEIPDLYEAVYPEAYVDELLRERNNAELREFELLGRANALREAIAPFVLLMKRTSGRIPTEELSLADWHDLSKAWKLLTANAIVSGLPRKGD